MKHLLTSILLAVTFTATAQCDMVTTETDRMTGRTTTSSVNYITMSSDGIDGIALMFIASEKTVSLYATVFGPSSCIDDKARMYILFTDGSRTTLTNSIKFNCENRFARIWFNRKDPQIAELLSKRIEAIRVETYKGSVTEEMTPEQADTFAETLRCVTN